MTADTSSADHVELLWFEADPARIVTPGHKAKVRFLSGSRDPEVAARARLLMRYVQGRS